MSVLNDSPVSSPLADFILTPDTDAWSKQSSMLPEHGGSQPKKTPTIIRDKAELINLII